MSSKHVIVLIAALLAAQATSAFDNEPHGFRGIAWQSTFEEFADEMKYKSEFGDGEYKVYLRDNDKMFIGEIPIKELEYRFWKGRFSSVAISVSKWDCDSLFDAFVDRFGQPSSQGKMGQKKVAFWTGAITHISFFEYRCHANISSTVIKEEQDQLREAATAEADALREADERPDF